MACFIPFRRRQKNSFTPEKDENKDTVLNSSDSTVQIGRYIRREETTFYPTKSTESLRLLPQRQSQLPQHGPNNQNSTLPQYDAAGADGATAANGNIAAHSIDGPIKKFITSNKVRNTNSNANGTIPNGSNQAKPHHHHVHQQHSQTACKLKPVKERRPTALPTEHPKIENDESSGNSVEDVCDGEFVGNNKMHKTKPAKFFIGSNGEDDDDDDEDEHEIDDDDDNDVVLVTPNNYNKQAVLALNSKLQLQRQTSSTISSPTVSMPSPTINLSPFFPNKLHTKLSSNSSSKTRKFGRGNSIISQEEQEKIFIPPPPPMPPTQLISPSLSVVSKSKSYANLDDSQKPTSARASKTFTSTEADVKIAEDEEASATHPSGNAKARSLRLLPQRQSQLPQHGPNNQNSTLPQYDAAGADGATAANGNIAAHSIDGPIKKFITSNKVRNTNSNANGTIPNGSNQAKPHHHHVHQQHSQTACKLKPVKERRPTALPTEHPKIENDESSGNSVEDVCDGSNGEDDDDDDEDEHEIDDDDDNDVVLVTPNNYNKQAVLALNSKLQLQRQTSSTISSPTVSMPSPTINLSPFFPNKLHTKLSSNSSSKTRKFGRGNSIISQEEQEKIFIPPPPPMPPTQLISPSLSVVSKSKSYANLDDSQKPTSARASKTFTSTEADVKIAEDEEASATHPSGNAKARSSNNGSETAITLQEALQSQYDDFSVNASESGTNATWNEDRDSGVQIEESTPSPKESDSSDETPKSHRVEGGLIFARANLPMKKDVQIDYIEKDEKTRNLIRNAIEKNDFLNNYMDTDRKEMVIDAMEMLHFHENDFIIQENDEGSEIYVSDTGTFDVIKQNKVIGRFGGGTIFGELAILYNAKRFASIRAISDAIVWKIDRDKFRKIMVISGSKEREENLNFLRSAPFLNDLPEDVLGKVVDLLQRKFFATNTCIVREGDIGNEFFIIRGGTVTIRKLNENGEERVVDHRKRGDYFGEQALLNADCRQASVYADAPGTEVLKLDREAFISYLGTIPQLRELPIEKSVNEARESNRKSEFDNEYAHIELTDLKKIATLGAGAFGKVDLVTYDTTTIFALKIVKKIDIVKQDQIEHIYNEKHVMMKCRSSPFIIELYKTFRNDKFVYFLMEACMGGDVWTVMSQRRFFDEKTARFIAGCVVEAFDFLHSHKIIYRDLKPENLMLTTDGYCKLVDFGFAKHIPTNQKTHTFAGTPEYVAPEIILDRGHDRSVDYWALGILIFELLVGKTPFREKNQIKIYQQILGGIDVIQMPSKIPKSGQNLIRALCKQLPAERLGYQRKGILDIKKHSWFDGLDWQKLKNKQLASPIRRPINSNTDIQHFGPSGVENEADPPSEISGWDIDF